MDFHKILLISDFDFTLTDSDHNIPQANLDAIRRFMDGGGKFCIGTGRGRTIFAPQLALVEVNAPCVISNGAVVYDFAEDRALQMFEFPPETVDAVERLMLRYKDVCGLTIESGFDNYLPAEVTYDFRKAFPRSGNASESDRRTERVPLPEKTPFREIPGPLVKFCFTGTPDRLDTLQAEAEAMGAPGIRSLPFLYEYSPASKGSSARWLAGELGRPVLAAVGDAPNDLSMLEAADFAFVPVSAGAEMQDLGFRPCAHIDTGALADVIRQLEAL